MEISFFKLVQPIWCVEKCNKSDAGDSFKLYKCLEAPDLWVKSGPASNLTAAQQSILAREQGGQYFSLLSS